MGRRLFIRVTIWYHEACWVMRTVIASEGCILSPHYTINSKSFLYTILLTRLDCKKGSYKNVKCWRLRGLVLGLDEAGTFNDRRKFLYVNVRSNIWWFHSEIFMTSSSEKKQQRHLTTYIHELLYNKCIECSQCLSMFSILFISLTGLVSI